MYKVLSDLVSREVQVYELLAEDCLKGEHGETVATKVQIGQHFQLLFHVCVCVWWGGGGSNLSYFHNATDITMCQVVNNRNSIINLL